MPGSTTPGKPLLLTAVAAAVLCAAGIAFYVLVGLRPAPEPPIAPKARGGAAVQDGPTRYQLRVSHPDGDDLFDLAPGGTVRVEGEDLAIVSVGPWAGLLPDALGKPMALAMLSTADGTAEKALFISEAWVYVDRRLALRLFWFDTEGEARDRASARVAGLESARWGVVDGGRVHWLASFLPGAAIELSDGTLVTLVGVDEGRAYQGGARPAIHIRTRDHNGVREAWHYAEDYGPEETVRFQCPSAYPRQVLICAWGDGQAFVGGLDTDAPPGLPSRLGNGVAAVALRSGHQLKVTQVHAAAVPITRENSPFVQAVLRGPAGELRIRQGEAVRSGDSLLRIVPR